MGLCVVESSACSYDHAGCVLAASVQLAAASSGKDMESLSLPSSGAMPLYVAFFWVASVSHRIQARLIYTWTNAGGSLHTSSNVTSSSRFFSLTRSRKEAADTKKCAQTTCLPQIPSTFPLLPAY